MNPTMPDTLETSGAEPAVARVPKPAHAILDYTLAPGAIPRAYETAPTAIVAMRRSRSRPSVL